MRRSAFMILARPDRTLTPRQPGRSTRPARRTPRPGLAAGRGGTDAPATNLTAAPPDAYLYIGWPNNGETVKSPFKVWFGLRNMGVAPAGVTKANTGHHHLLIDTDLPPHGRADPQQRAASALRRRADRDRRSTCRPAGTRCSCSWATPNHVPFNPPVMSKKITVTVK